MKLQPAGIALATVLAAELASAAMRFSDRKRLFADAQARARATGRPLVVIGAPGNGIHTRIMPAYGCGDVCVDLTGCTGCPASVTLDLTRERVTQVRDDTAVVYVSCVLEYVSDPAAAYREILRMAGSAQNVFVVTVSGLSLTARLYPYARWVITAAPPTSAELRYVPVVAGEGVFAWGLLATLAYAAWRPSEPEPEVVASAFGGVPTK